MALYGFPIVLRDWSAFLCYFQRVSVDRQYNDLHFELQSTKQVAGTEPPDK